MFLPASIAYSIQMLKTYSLPLKLKHTKFLEEVDKYLEMSNTTVLVPELLTNFYMCGTMRS